MTSGTVLASLEGRTILITGTSRGLGRALAPAFAAEGARIVVHARRAVDLEPVTAACREAGAAEVVEVAADLLAPDAARRIAEAAAPGPHLLILNAGALGSMKPLLECDLDEWSHVMRVNVDAQVALLKACLPAMIAQRGGVILGLSSALGRFALPRYGPYCASKFAVEGLMKTVHEEHAADGIVALPIAPGMVQTEMLEAALMGADTSEFQTPEATAAAFVRLVRTLTPAQGGESLDIEPWL